LGEREGVGESEPVAVDLEICAMVGGGEGIHCRRTILALKVRLTVYKVCWKESGCFDSDILATFDSVVFDDDGTERKKKNRGLRKEKGERNEKGRSERP
jgi:hypothetical protein